ncbi:hypothetical protein ZHAS_00009994 [Anopheles sinensis]|uniref:Uncharacterized protein n=1 Tax=Anopheles sinensis TaxID=74873 RepID=A0A084VWG5_ANOSI|nr:hypothetical protein ZHAS_00009994 [Anopheles sinensis]
MLHGGPTRQYLWSGRSVNTEHPEIPEAQHTGGKEQVKMIQPTRVLQIAKEKSQRLLALDSERFTCKLDKFLTVYHGYSQLKPKIFPKRMSAMMFPSDVVVIDAGDRQEHRHFQSGFGSTASLKRHRMDWSEKYERTRPGYVDSIPGDHNEPADHSRKLHIVTGAEVQDRRKPYGATVSGRGKKPHAKSPRRVVLRTANGPESSAEILCSSVLLTYREGLFHNEKQMQIQRDTNCSDV